MKTEYFSAKSFYSSTLIEIFSEIFSGHNGKPCFEAS